jgi:isochorismate synthase
MTSLHTHPSASEPKGPTDPSFGRPGALDAADIRLAIDRAQHLDHRMHLRLNFALEGVDAWALLGDHGSHWSAFHDATRGVSLWTEGQAWVHQRLVADIHEVRAEAERFTHQFMESSLSAGEEKLPPIFIGGSQFKPSAHSGNWQNWPGSLFFVPRLLISQKPDGLRAYIVEGIDGDDTAEGVWSRYADRLADTRRRLRAASPRAAPRVESDSNEVPWESKEEWEVRVETARRSIETSSLHKVVLARATAFTSPRPPCPSETLRALRALNPECTTFGLSLPSGEVFFGATPEALITVSGGSLSTHAVAGTAPRGQNERADDRLGEQLLSSVKERMEHAIVTNTLAQQLSPHCRAIEVARQPELMKLPSAQHLNSPITGLLRSGTHVLDLVEELHPTPALGGAPSQAAARWLARHESLCRGWYGAPIGWFDGEGNGHFAVAIRSAWMDRRQVVAFAGAGIVHGSVPSEEWEETELKLQTIQDALRFRGDPI